jgi:hypothetical protein
VIRRLALVVLLAGAIAPLAAAEPEPPAVTVPPDMTVEAQSSAGAAVTYTASATDFQGKSIPVECDPLPGSTFPLGPTVVTCTARSQGQTTTKTFTITIVDRTAPVVTVPPDKSLQTLSSNGVRVSYSASATDLVDGPVPVSCSPSSGSIFSSGTTTVSCRAGDRHGNTATAEFRVDVSILRTAPRAARRAALFSPPARAVVAGPTMLAWRAVPRTSFYNVQVHRNGRKILSRWPSRARFGLRRSWQHEGRTFRLRPGVYTWYVWPGFGTLAKPRFGKLLGRSSFRVV